MSTFPREASQDIKKAAGIIRSGGVVAMPTETVYGLAANALNAQAVSRIFAIKERPFFDPLIVHVASPDQLLSCVSRIPESAQKLMDQFWPGPLTLVLPKSEIVPELVTSGLDTVAVRMPSHPLALALIRESGLPLAAPSANPFGAISPTNAEHVRRSLGEKVDLILDGGPCSVGVESTIVACTGEQPVLLRPGGISVEAIEKISGPLGSLQKKDETPASPGRLPSHYAPRTPLFLRDQMSRLNTGRTGLLTFLTPADPASYAAVEILSGKGDLCEAAANLFDAMHRLDQMNLDIIIADLCPEEGLGRAINDRLRRAAEKKVPD